MKRKTLGLLAVVTLGALVASGCAKKDMVKQDEPIATPAAAKAAPTAKPQQVEQKNALQNAAPSAADLQKQAAKQAAAQAEQLKKGLQTVYFGFDSSKLSDDARNGLVKDADVIKKLGKAKIRVEGNCDERGSDDYNLALGEKRAKEAVQYLANLGVPADRLTSVSYGKEKPAAAGHDEASWAKNRRDDFVVLQ
jgi:peptidoglycan-associated lipoprotein